MLQICESGFQVLRIMEENEALRTVDCLRGRLLAERSASRIAKEEAMLMSSKLIELEKQLNEETKARNRAEKKLGLLLEKLRSLKITYALEESEEFVSSYQKTESKSTSSTASSERESKFAKSSDNHGYSSPEAGIGAITPGDYDNNDSCSTASLVTGKVAGRDDENCDDGYGDDSLERFSLKSVMDKQKAVGDVLAALRLAKVELRNLAGEA